MDNRLWLRICTEFNLDTKLYVEPKIKYTQTATIYEFSYDSRILHIQLAMFKDEIYAQVLLYSYKLNHKPRTWKGYLLEAWMITTIHQLLNQYFRI